MPQVVSATYARNNFSEILGLVTYRGSEFMIEKKGKKVAKVGPVVENKPSKKLSKKQVGEILEDMKKNALKVKSWEEFKKLSKDLHDPKISWSI